MKHIARSLTVALCLSLGLQACAPGADPSELGSTTQALTVAEGRVETAPVAERVGYQYSLVLRGEGTLLDRFRLRAVNELAGVVVFDLTDDANASRREIAERLTARSPRNGRYYYDAAGVAAGEAILADLERPTPGLITVTFEATADGERVSISCLDGQRWERVYSPSELRDVEARVGELLDEVRRQVEVFRTPRP